MLQVVRDKFKDIKDLSKNISSSWNMGNKKQTSHEIKR
jgi:hypothetical protein